MNNMHIVRDLQQVCFKFKMRIAAKELYKECDSLYMSFTDEALSI